MGQRSESAERAASTQTLARISARERAYVAEVLDSQFRNSGGTKMVQRLEETFAELFGVKYAISQVNGTATLHSALVATGVGPGDEVIVPPLTMAATAFSVMQAGASPVFADVDPRTWNLDPADVARRLSPRTRAIMPVALYGLPPDLDPMMEMAGRWNLAVIEDDAQCFLGYYKGRICGGIGHLASFSFQSSKHVTCGEGGMVTTNDESLAEKVRRFGALGYAATSAKAGGSKITRDLIQDPNYKRHVSMGFNYRLSELSAAVALAQVERLPELVDKRIRSAQLYADAIRGCAWLVPQYVPEGYRHSYWTYAVRLANDVGFSWYDFRRKYMELGGDGIYAAWQLNYLEPAFSAERGASPRKPAEDGAAAQEYRPGLCPVAESLQPRLLQFKTNYLQEDVAYQKAEALARTVAFFGR